MKQVYKWGFLLGGVACLSLAARAAESVAPDLSPFIVTPAAGAAPRFNGAAVFGVRPGSPVLYTVAVAGQRPMTLRPKACPRARRSMRRKG